MDVNALLLNAFICFIGLALHFSMKWFEHRQVSPVGLFTYIAAVPAQSMISLLATVGAFTVTAAMEWLNPGMAFACGYMGNSIAENLATQFAKTP